MNFIGGPNQPDEIPSFLIRKWKPCFSWICQKVEDRLRLFSRQFVYPHQISCPTCKQSDVDIIFFCLFIAHTVPVSPIKSGINVPSSDHVSSVLWCVGTWNSMLANFFSRGDFFNQEKSQSSTFWHIQEKQGFYFLMRKLGNS